MAQRLMSLQSMTRSPGQQAKPIVQTRANLRRAHRTDARRCKLDGQWNAIEPADRSR